MIPPNILEKLLQALYAFETAMRRLNPVNLSEIREELLVHLEPLSAVRRFLEAGPPGMPDENIRAGLLRACDLMHSAIRSFADEEDLQAAYISALRSARKFCRAQEALFDLRDVIPELNRYFLEPGVAFIAQPSEKTCRVETGLIQGGASSHPHARGGYSLYVPERYAPERAWPLVVALHGGYSHGRDFIWSWMREARSRGFMLFAPTSQAMTWSIAHLETDEKPLNSHLEELFSRYHIDQSRIFLTGMSDGGTFALAMGLSPNRVWQSIAPVSCALPPVDLKEAKGKRILWVHGAQDWIFPLGWTVQACKELLHAGVDIKLKVIDDLAHTYPREANEAILQWFGMDRVR